MLAMFNRTACLVLVAFAAVVLVGCAGELNVAVTAETCAGSVTTTVIENGKLVDAHVSAKPGTTPQLEISGGGVGPDDVKVEPLSLGKKAELKNAEANWALHLMGWLDVVVTAIATILGLSANNNGCQGSSSGGEPFTRDLDGFAGDTAVTIEGQTFNILAIHCEELTGSVPNVIGMTQTEATTAIQANCLVVGTVTLVYSATVPVGVVISSVPASGEVLACGTPVDLIVSKGPEPVGTTTVPNVVGMTQAAATSALNTANLVVGEVTQAFSATVPAGLVLSANPVGGTIVPKGSSVALVVSKGSSPVETSTVPNVVGMTQAAATSALNTANLVVGTVTEVYDSTVPLGSVISTSPIGGTVVPKGSSVALVVSKGPEVVPVLGVTLITPLDGAVIIAGLTKPVTYSLTGPNPVDIVIVNPDGKKSLTDAEIELLFTAKVFNKEVYKAFNVATGQTITTQMTFLYVGYGLVTVAAKDTVTGEIRTAAHAVTIAAAK
jgi:beta-lactam-binding protein with PASTA domain